MESQLRARAAIVHDWFQGFHGSERVVASMLDLFASDPDVYTFQAARELLPARLAAAIRKESALARMPLIRQRGHDPGRWRMLLPYMPHWFGSLDLSGYDVVISSSHACAVGVKPPPGALHLCYCYTPMRYIWVLEAEEDRVTGLKAPVMGALRGRLRRWDLRASNRPAGYVAISTAVAERIKRIYGREAQVVHPPVAIGEFDPQSEKDPQLVLWVHRLVSYKRPLEVAEAFRRLPHLRLIMVGVGPLEGQLRRSLPSNVELHGWIERVELTRLFERAAAFIHVGEEDFGISMVEALAAGTPVLALDRGGAVDIVRPGIDGMTISNPADVETMSARIREIVDAEWDRAALRARAEEFSEPAFQSGLAEVLRAHGAT